MTGEDLLDFCDIRRSCTVRYSIAQLCSILKILMISDWMVFWCSCCRLSGYRDVSQRLIELLYEVPDRLTYFLCRRRPDHASGQHFLVPEIADCLEAPQLTKEARGKLQQVKYKLSIRLANRIPMHSINLPPHCLNFFLYSNLRN